MNDDVNAGVEVFLAHPRADQEETLAALTSELLPANPEELLPVFGRSAEFEAIHQLVEQGSQLGNLVVVEPALFEFVE